MANSSDLARLVKFHNSGVELSFTTRPQDKHVTPTQQPWPSLTPPFIRLTLIGIITQIIYVIYIVAFPLISNTQAGGPAADLEILMRDYRWFAPIYALGIFLLYYLFWQAIRIVATAGTQEPGDTFQVSRLKLLILTFGLLFGFTLVWLYPITANDLFRYVLRGRVWAIYGESPMLVPPNNFPNDPYIAFAGEFGNWVSGYGPLWEIMVQAPLRLGATNMVPGAISLKLIVLLGYLVCAVLLGWFSNPDHSSSSKDSSLIALTFFAWNPLILIQGPGNGHNDLLFMTLIVLGIILWKRNLWWAATLALTLSVLAKAAALLIIPLFAVVLLRSQPTWRQRILKGLGAAFLGLVTIYLGYSLLGPVSETLHGVTAMLSTRRGFAIASEVRMILREVLSWEVAETLPRTTARYIFICFYAWLLLQLWRKKLTLVTAGFLAYFSQLMLGRTFRIWYPMWLIPFAALHLTPATFWRTFLFGLTAELSIINYFVVWRWWLRDLPWEKLGLSTTLYYWPVMHTLTVPWLFGLPLFGPVIIKWWQRRT
jgi:alpha-1,6-mannosyltransferase